MRLYVIRHGKADPRAASGPDAERQLAPEGRQQARFLGERLARSEPRVEVVLSSPLDRAIQTARLICAGLGLDPRIEQALGADATPGGVIELIQSHMQVQSLAIVGHNPTLSGVVALLIGAPGGVSLRTGQAAVLDLDGCCEPGRATLREMIRHGA